MPAYRIERVLPGQGEHIERIRAYILREWCITREEADNYLDVSCGRRLPKAWIAVASDEAIIGHVIVAIERAGFGGINREPWLQALFVNDEWRGRGIGRKLVRAAEEDCRRCRYRYLYLDTVDAERYYRALGWETIGSDFWQAVGERVMVMRKRLITSE